MKTLCLLVLGLTLFSCVNAQYSDILILKKHNRTVRTFFPGDEIMFNTPVHYFDAYITSVNNDSLFLIQYDIRQIPTSLGVVVADTVATYRFGVNYKDIIRLGRDRNRNFDWSGSGAVLLGGGTLLALVGLGTWVFTKPNTQYYASPYLVGSAALLAGIGYLLSKSGDKQIVLGKKYLLEYIHVK